MITPMRAMPRTCAMPPTSAKALGHAPWPGSIRARSSRKACRWYSIHRRSTASCWDIFGRDFRQRHRARRVLSQGPHGHADNFGEGISIIDDPHRLRGLRSKPFDGEGVANARRAFIDKGVLTSWILECASARQLGLQTTGHAARGTGGPPAPSATNLYMEAGALSPAAELIADIKRNLYITELMGMGVNGVTGDYSHGAAGFWIENGQIAFPVFGSHHRGQSQGHVPCI